MQIQIGICTTESVDILRHSSGGYNVYDGLVTEPLELFDSKVLRFKVCDSKFLIQALKV